MRFSQKSQKPYVLSFEAKKVHVNGLDFRQNDKNLVFGLFWAYSGFSWGPLSWAGQGGAGRGQVDSLSKGFPFKPST